jgi:hypothetical protein
VTPGSAAERRLVWAFWIASGLALVGGVASLAFAGLSSRVSGAAVPFAVAAIALGASARLYRQGRPIVIALYFVAGLAIVYGILVMVAVPLRLTVVGVCPPAPARCLAGFERPMTEGEQTALWFGVGMGAVAILVGYFGLFSLMRGRGSLPEPPPPVRSIPPVESAPQPEPEPEPEPTEPAPPKAG